MQMQGLLYEEAGGLSGPVNRWGTCGLHSCGEADPHPVPLSPSLSLSQLRAGVTVPTLNTRSWPRSGWHVAAGLTQSLQVVYSLHARSVCLQCVCKVKQPSEMWRGTGVANTEALVFLTPLLPSSSLPFYSSYSVSPTHPCLSLFSPREAAFHLDFFSTQVQTGEAEIFFSPLFEFSSRSFNSFYIQDTSHPKV